MPDSTAREEEQKPITHKIMHIRLRIFICRTNPFAGTNGMYAGQRLLDFSAQKKVQKKHVMPHPQAGSGFLENIGLLGSTIEVNVFAFSDPQWPLPSNYSLETIRNVIGKMIPLIEAVAPCGPP